MCYLPDADRPPPGRRSRATRTCAAGDGIRNTLWFTWLRRPAGRALRRTVRLARPCRATGCRWPGSWTPSAGCRGWSRERRVVPPEVEAGYRLLEESQRHSTARRYVS